MPTNPGFLGLPLGASIRQITDKVNQMLRGGLNIGGSVTLDSSGTTTVTDDRISGSSKIILQETNEAATLLSRRPYISAKAKGSFVITNPGANGTETMDFHITSA